MENPTYQEIADVIKSLELEHLVQPTKHYSREGDRDLWQLGRVRSTALLKNKKRLVLYKLLYSYKLL